MFEVSGALVLSAIRDSGAKDVRTIVRVLRMPSGPSRWKLEASCSAVATAVQKLIEIGAVTLHPKTIEDPLNAREIRVTDTLTEIQEAFGLSLTKMVQCTRHSILQVEPKFGIPNEDASSPEVFVIMPFDPPLRPIYDDHIAPVAKALDLSVGRADDFFTAHAVMRDVWTAIFRCKVVIADCTGRNPNVFYEMGMAHVVGRPVILTTQQESDVPFDIRHLRYINYSYTPPGMIAFEEALKKTICDVLERDKRSEDEAWWHR
ncbi:MAG TPA: hypothetical protein VEX43_09855 [Chthoniobacterales bacterium]|nr:hypothetical protein [Chthoniobacterales bacterium]